MDCPNSIPSSIRRARGSSRDSSKHPRSGAILLCVLACSLIAALLAAATLQLSLRNMKEVRLVQQRRQALWIVGAGVQRAKQRLSDPDYRGEAWSVPQTVTHSAAATVRIEVNAADARTPNVDSRESSKKKEEVREAEDRETNPDSTGRRNTSRALIVTVHVEYESENASGLAIQQSHSFRYVRGDKPRDATP